MLFSTNSLDKFLLLCEVSQKSIGRISRYLEISIKGDAWAEDSEKKTRKFRWEEKWNFRLEKVVQFGRKPRYVAVPDRLSSRGPGTGTNYEKRAMHKSIPPR